MICLWPIIYGRPYWHVFHGPVILFFILQSVSWMNVILWDNESVWCGDWSYTKCRSQWLLFHGPVILSDILEVCLIVESGWMSYFRTMSQCDAMTDRIIDVGHGASCSIEVQWCLPACFCLLHTNNFSFICKVRFRWATLSCDSSYSSTTP